MNLLIFQELVHCQFMDINGPRVMKIDNNRLFTVKSAFLRDRRAAINARVVHGGSLRLISVLSP
ncbi:hypothetical protein [Vibrio europaeus]|uniref:Uncharacterized protein n=1 Tax=Vibrio europaeus TaxID=300876 RepID=A0ABT5GYM1_9VIBR|nr:hypothetical protein [Vibrio europaeus]MDC5708442.1 hypothetical protein [Vibrio europaeus]MDC5713104.1 hypothetical protein [Vibrio europaeus]MDC5728125.1 hypothetical protein [Vibrio europaeus]MDC5733281.1 hypothetical protein [Vibrio europaeus]MDC5742342.1 hypothetical protein [Vibrio europaeus]